MLPTVDVNSNFVAIQPEKSPEEVATISNFFEGPDGDLLSLETLKILLLRERTIDPGRAHFELVATGDHVRLDGP